MKFNNIKTNSIKKPLKNPSLKLVGTDGNAFALIGRTKDHNRKHKIYSNEDMNIIRDECMSGDYNHLLATLIYFFNVK